jgi:cell division protein FtsI (penicillin-binding protein 3)
MAENEIVNLKPGNPAIYYRAGNSKDFDFLYKNMQANAKIDVGSEYVIGLPTGDSVHYAPRNIKANVVPKLTGMTAKDAVYLLEDMGLNVKIVGSGFVTSQSLEAGTKVTKGKSITLKLSDS